DYHEMKKAYDRVIKNISLDSAVNTYKQYLVAGFMGMEYVATNWMSFDISGFAKQQIQAINNYERFLIEMGQRSYSSFGSSFPVEIRLLFMIGFNAIIFYITKRMFSGGNVDGIFSMFNNVNESAKPSVNPNRGGNTTKPMQGPSLSPNDIENIIKNGSH